MAPQTRSGTVGSKPSGVTKNTKGRKTREDSEIATQKKKIEDRRKERQKELESLQKDLLAAESQLKDAQLTQDERAKLQERSSRFRQDIQVAEDDIKKAEEDLMDIDTEEHAGAGPSPQASENMAPTPMPTAPENASATPRDQTPARPHRDTAVASTETRSSGGGVNFTEEDDTEEVLVRMDWLSMDDSEGHLDAWFMRGRAKKLIVRYGPKRAGKYVVRSGTGYNTDHLQQVSDSDTRLCDIVDKIGGIKHRRYGIQNVEGIVGVAILESENPWTYVKVEWKNIAEDDRHLCPDGYSWITKTNVEKMLRSKDRAMEVIMKAWDEQEKRYKNWERGQPIGTPDREPTPFPLAVSQKTTRKGRRKPSIAIKREGTPPPAVNTINAASTDSSDGSAPQINYPALTATPEGTGNETGSPAIADKPVPRTEFSRKAYMERMVNTLNVDKGDMEAYVAALAVIEANYDIYKGKMLQHGAVEVDVR